MVPVLSKLFVPLLIVVRRLKHFFHVKNFVPKSVQHITHRKVSAVKAKAQGRPQYTDVKH
jgi:hypothetical protein